jgi:hypothetical protein
MAKVTNVVRFYSPPKNAILLGCDESRRFKRWTRRGRFLSLCVSYHRP